MIVPASSGGVQTGAGGLAPIALVTSAPILVPTWLQTQIAGQAAVGATPGAQTKIQMIQGSDYFPDIDNFLPGHGGAGALGGAASAGGTAYCEIIWEA
jgi:hypothetical protein